MDDRDFNDLIKSIRSGNPLNEGKRIAESTLCAIMGRESAYSGKRITWDEIMSSDLKLGPETLHMGNVDETYETPVPGTAIKS